MMKVAISVSESHSNAVIEPQFERASYYVIVNLDHPTDRQVLSNPNSHSVSSNGILAAQMLINLGAEAVVTGWCDPGILRIFEIADIAVFQITKGTISEIIRALKKQTLELLNQTDQIPKTIQ